MTTLTDTEMSTEQTIRQMQRAWAESQGLKYDSAGYVQDVGINLRRPLSPTATAGFGKGAGSELGGKMRALHSSSALVANFFDFWVDRDKSPLLAAMGIDKAIVESLDFERRLPTSLRGTPPHLDVTLTLVCGTVVAVESKFTEHLSRSRRDRPDFAPAYFPQSNRLWESVGLPRCQALAEELNGRESRYAALGACQLLKHALGLATQLGDRFKLLYLYYEHPEEMAATHTEELQEFASRVGEETRFEAVTYQEVYGRLRESGMSDAEYLDYIEYLGARYFPDLQ